MNNIALKYILDIESVIAEIDFLKEKVKNNYNLFQKGNYSATHFATDCTNFHRLITVFDGYFCGDLKNL